MKSLLYKMVWVLVLAVVFAPAAVFADPIIDFNISTQTVGTISYAGGGAPLLGVGIVVDSVTGIATPENPGVTLTITGGSLDFSTGGFLGFNSTQWFFDGGGAVSITGDIGLGSGPESLMSGMWDPFPTVTSTGPNSGVLFGSFTDRKAHDLLDFFGLEDGPFAGAMNPGFTMVFPATPPSAFTSDVITAFDVANSPAVPEPASLVLLGSGLVGIAGAARRKLFS